MDSLEITDSQALPIQGIKYGPLMHEEENATVIVGPIKCQPPALHLFAKFSVEGKIKNLENDLTEQISTVKTEMSQKLTESQDENKRKDEVLEEQISTVKTEMSEKLEEHKEEIDLKLVALDEKMETKQPNIVLPSQCYSYKTLTDSSRRYDNKHDWSYSKSKIHCDSMSYSVNSNSKGSGRSPDWNGPGWYRVSGQAGTQISEHSYLTSRASGNNAACGTHYGGWLTGGHPVQPGQTVSRRVCFNKSCGSFKDIQVTNCLTFYVYDLKKPPGCYCRYCTQ